MKWTRSSLLIAFAVFALSFNQGVVNWISTNYFREELGFGFVFIVVSVVATQFMRCAFPPWPASRSLLAAESNE